MVMMMTAASVPTTSSSLMAVLLLLACAVVVADGFSTPFSGTSRKSPREVLRFASRRSASPKAEFDLKAIEAFEAQLLAEEQKQKNDGAGLEGSVSVEEETKNHHLTLVVPPNLHTKRIDAALADLWATAASEPKLSRSACASLVANRHVRILCQDSAEETIIDRKSFRVETGMKLLVSITADNGKPTEVLAEDLPLDILYEDEHMIVLNKAAHMVVHPAAGNWNGTVVNALAYYLPRSSYGRGDFVDPDGKIQQQSSTTSDDHGDDANSVPGHQQHEDDLDLIEGQVVTGDADTASFRPGIVHRLDKGTTGILVVAKTSHALSTLSTAFANREVHKTYLTVTVGNPGQNVKVDKPIGRHPVHRQRMRVVPQRQKKNKRQQQRKRVGTIGNNNRPPSQVGRRALSQVDTLAFDGKLALVKVKIETGRTHQIRVHLQDRHTPIYGDDVYGLADWNKRLFKSHQIDRPLLHAYKLALNHPVSGELMEFTAPLDSDMMQIANTIVPPGSNPDLTNLLTWS